MTCHATKDIYIQLQNADAADAFADADANAAADVDANAAADVDANAVMHMSMRML
jgi:hypothetical protein